MGLIFLPVYMDKLNIGLGHWFDEETPGNLLPEFTIDGSGSGRCGHGYQNGYCPYPECFFSFKGAEYVAVPGPLLTGDGDQNYERVTFRRSVLKFTSLFPPIYFWRKV